MNLARLFAYTRRIEDDLNRALERIAVLETALEERTAYAFSLCGRLTPEQVRERAAQPKPDVAPLPPRSSLRNVRRGLFGDAMGKIMRRAGEIDSADDAMKARADEFVKQSNGSGSN